MASHGPLERPRFLMALKVTLLGLLLLGLTVATGAIYFGAHHGLSVQGIEETIRSLDAGARDQVVSPTPIEIEAVSNCPGPPGRPGPPRMEPDFVATRSCDQKST